ncbi:uncharacterized protein at5g03900 chloroplastic [Phtheirospermum japonicum]|uniref:Uncharacterized protein at5g03900 chloroplastic n=1 Tax=Phtheirospermum japonicum TaxID=374723 RepID=A0A830C9K8_9LAMI|nr:uncharacterized protein at5g03900 chloroplastic [Phtheirospermum japonicum]
MAACISSDYYLAGTPRPKLQSPKPFKPSQLHYFSNPRLLVPPQSTKIRALTSVRSRCCRTTSVVRACSAESDKLPSYVRRRAMDAIDSSRRRVTIGGVVSKSLNTYEAQKALQALAADTNGFLEVSDEGDVVYVFLKDYRLKLSVKSLRMKIDSFLEKGKVYGSSLLVEGLVWDVIGCVQCCWTLCIDLTGRYVVLVLSLDIDISMVDERCFCLYEVYPAVGIIRDGLGTLCGGRFIEYVFSLVFGDGDPNQGIEEKRWKMIGQYIALHGGVVAAEELAPYLDPETTVKMVLCKVDDEEFEFVNFFLFHNLLWITMFGAVLRVSGSSIVNLSFMSYIFLPLLRMYAIYVVSFYVIATFRSFAYRKRNDEVVKRNEAREQLAKALELPDLSLKQK